MLDHLLSQLAKKPKQINLRGAYGNKKRKLYQRRRAPMYRGLTVRPTRYLANPVKRRIVSQLKWSTDYATYVSQNKAWTWRLLNNNITQGTGSQQDRIGDRICVEKLHMRMNIQTESITGVERWPKEDSNQTWGLRVVIVEDKAPNGALAEPQVVFETSSGSPLQQYNNLDYSERFRTLYDKRIMFNQGESCGGTLEIDIKPEVLMKYTGSSGEIGNIITGAIILFVASEAYSFAPAEDAEMFTITSLTRMRYTDL